MQYQLRQQVIEPRRSTFTRLAERLGDRPASRYEEGSIDVQAREHFHYRPLWDPAHELYDADFSTLKLSDPDSFTDPRQYYYAPYVINRAALHEAFGKTLDYAEGRGLLRTLPEGWRAVLAELIVPLRHYELAAQLVSAAGARFAYGTTVEQCLTYAAFDRIGLAQMLSRIGLALGEGSDAVLVAGRQSWMEEPTFQGLRRLAEELVAESDWALAAYGLDLTDRLLIPLIWGHLDEAALTGGAGAYSLLAQHFAAWFGDHRRWWDALLAAWRTDPAHGAANRQALAAAAARWLPAAEAALTDLASAVDARISVGAADYVAQAAQTLQAEIAETDKEPS